MGISEDRIERFGKNMVVFLLDTSGSYFQHRRRTTFDL